MFGHITGVAILFFLTASPLEADSQSVEQLLYMLSDRLRRIEEYLVFQTSVMAKNHESYNQQIVVHQQFISSVEQQMSNTLQETKVQNNMAQRLIDEVKPIVKAARSLGLGGKSGHQTKHNMH